MFCSKCGEKLEGNFCTNCGTPAGQIVNNTTAAKPVNNDHSTYRLVVGIIMVILGLLIFIASLNDETVAKYELAGYDMTLGFMIPDIATAVGGILSIISRNNNQMLLFSAIAYIGAAVCNACGSQDVSLLCILCVIFGILNFVFYSKKNKQTN